MSKYPTQHRVFHVHNKMGEKDRYEAHRDGTEVWVTRVIRDKSETIYRHKYQFVSQAKAFMANPSAVG